MSKSEHEVLAPYRSGPAPSEPTRVELAYRAPYRSGPASRDPTRQELARYAMAQHLAGEKLVWVGWPAGGWRFSAGDVIAVPFSLLWGGFAIFWEAMALLSHAPLFFCLWGIPFVLMGQYIIWGRFVFDARRRARTIYGLTDARAIILVGGRNPRVTSIALGAWDNLDLSEGRGGSGTIRFGASPWHHRSLGTAWPGNRQPPAFECIENVRFVYQKLLGERRG